MNFKKIIKSLLLSTAALAMVGGTLNVNTPANAKRRYHYRYSHKARRHAYRRKDYRRHKLYRHKNSRHYRTSKRNKKQHKGLKTYYVYGAIVRLPNYKTYKKDVKELREGRMTIYRNSNKEMNYLVPVKKAHHHKSTHKAKHISTNNHVNNISHYPHKKYTYADNEAQMKSQTLKDINSDRQDNGLNSVQENSELDQLAAVRAKQASQNFTHYDPNTNEPYELEDAKNMGINFGIQYGIDGPNQSPSRGIGFSENLAGTALNIEEERNDGSTYYDHNGTEAANDINDSLMNHDTSSNQSTNNGHRKNILYAPWKYVGVGVAHKGSEYTIAQEFATWVK